MAAPIPRLPPVTSATRRAVSALIVILDPISTRPAVAGPSDPTRRPRRTRMTPNEPAAAAGQLREQRRSRAIAMSAEELETFLGGEHTCRVATVSATGEPHVAPLWFVWVDG